ncbi:AAA family ATPase, partial [Dietzia sp. UCD-THP]|uniref:AAA family ATPase n=1 Tax=Dietzia sp. UCD-THP TaxID=1292020 RepID=UPI00187CDA07
MTSSTTDPFGDYVPFSDPEDDHHEQLANSDFADSGTSGTPMVPSTKYQQADAGKNKWERYLMTGDHLDQLHLEPLQWVVDGMIPEGLTMLAAPPKMGKSWFVMDIALAVASGGKALSGIDVGPARPVLHLSLEDSKRRLKQRAKQLLGDEQLPPMWTSVVTLPPNEAVPLIDYFLTKHDGQRPLVIVDVFTKAAAVPAGKAEGYRADYRMMEPWKALCESHPGAGIILVHHTRKMASEDRLDLVSGTNGIAGSCDTIMLLSRERESADGTLYVTGRDTEESAY